MSGLHYISRGGGRRGVVVTTLPLVARATNIDLVDSMLIHFGREGFIPKGLLDLSLLLLENIECHPDPLLDRFFFLSASLWQPS
jgi:hypothetical protein